MNGEWTRSREEDLFLSCSCESESLLVWVFEHFLECSEIHDFWFP